MQAGVALRPLWANRALQAGVALRPLRALRACVSLVSLGSVLAGSAVRALLAGIALLPGVAFRARVALRAFEIHGLRIRKPAVVRPREIARRAHRRRKRHAVASVCPVLTRRTVRAVFPGQAVRTLRAVLAGVSLRSLNALRAALAGLTLRALQGAVVDELAGNAVENADVVGLCRAHAVGVSGLRRRFLRRVQLGLALVVAQHREALAGLTARALLALNALLAARALRADGASLASQSLRTLLALRALRAGRANLAFLALRACLTLNALWASRAGFALFSLRSCFAGLALVSLGTSFAACAGCAGRADGAALTLHAALALLALVPLGAGVALRAGRGNTRVGKSAVVGVPLEPVSGGAVHVGHLGDRRLRARPGLEHLVHPVFVRRRRLGRPRRAQRRLRHRPPRSALGDHTVHRVGELGQSLARSRGVCAAEHPYNVAVLARDARGVRHGVALPLHRQREYARAVQPCPRIRNPRPDDPLRFGFALPAQRQIGKILHLDRSHRISYPLS